MTNGFRGGNLRRVRGIARNAIAYQRPGERLESIRTQLLRRRREDLREQIQELEQRQGNIGRILTRLKEFDRQLATEIGEVPTETTPYDTTSESYPPALYPAVTATSLGTLTVTDPTAPKTVPMTSYNVGLMVSGGSGRALASIWPASPSNSAQRDQGAPPLGQQSLTLAGGTLSVYISVALTANAPNYLVATLSDQHGNRGTSVAVPVIRQSAGQPTTQPLSLTFTLTDPIEPVTVEASARTYRIRGSVGNVDWPIVWLSLWQASDYGQQGRLIAVFKAVPVDGVAAFEIVAKLTVNTTNRFLLAAGSDQFSFRAGDLVLIPPIAHAKPSESVYNAAPDADISTYVANKTCDGLERR